jgi:hypothetical protein
MALFSTIYVIYFALVKAKDGIKILHFIDKLVVQIWVIKELTL